MLSLAAPVYAVFAKGWVFFTYGEVSFTYGKLAWSLLRTVENYFGLFAYAGKSV